MKTKYLTIIFALFIIAWPGLSKSQTINTTAGTVQDCPGDIVVSIDVTDFYGVGAISLVLQYNTGTLTYVNYENLHSEISTGNLVINPVGDQIFIGWTSLAAANIGNGTLMEFRFSGVTGNSNMNWVTQTPGYCEYSDIDGNILPATFTNGNVTVYGIPTVLNHPVDQNVLPGQNTSFSITASGTSLVYRWQFSPDNGSNWFDLNNNSTYSGVTGTTLYISNTPYSLNEFQYRCKVEGTCTPVAFSNPGILTLTYPITTSLPTQSYCPGNLVIPVSVDTLIEVAALSLTMSYDAGILTYSGYQNMDPAFAGGNFIVNATGTDVYITWASSTPVSTGTITAVELIFNSVTGTGNLNWDTQSAGACEYSDISGNEITSVFINGQTSIYGLPQITNQPVDRVIAENTNTNFSLSATGSGLAYQWQISTDGGSVWNDLTNGGHYSGVTNPTLSVSNGLLSMNGYVYRCIVSGYCPPDAVSDVVSLTVLANITTNCGSITECPGPVIVPVDVTHFVNVASFSLTLEYNESVLTYTGNQNLHTSLSGGNFVANAAGNKVYLTWTNTTPVSFGDDLLIELLFTGIAGTSPLTWDTQTTGNCEYSDVNGNLIYTTFVNGNAIVYAIPEIIADPVDKTVNEGENVSFSVSATGTGLNYHWQISVDGGSNWNYIFNGGAYAGVTSATLQINNTPLSFDENMYRCDVGGSCPPNLFSGSATLYVNRTIITSIGDVTNSCTGNITVPIYVAFCTDVGAISLTLNYDPGVLTFDGYLNVNPELSTGLLSVFGAGGKVFLSYATTDTVDIVSGMLVEYNFTLASGSSNLSWETQTPGACEYSDINGNLVAGVYNNGTVSVISNPLIASAGTNTTILQGATVTLNGSASGGVGGYTYLWTPPDYLSDPAIPNPDATPPVTTTYTLTVTSGVCQATSDVTITVIPSGLEFNLKAFLEGPFNVSQMGTALNSGGQLPLSQPYNTSPWNYSGTESVAAVPNGNVVDWVLLELRETAGAASTATSGTMIARQAAFILNNGTIVDMDGSSNPVINVSVSDNLYLVLWHRNHLGIMSAIPLTESGGVYNYDFSSGSGQVYGGMLAHKQLAPSAWGMIGGDGNSNQQVNNIDKLDVWKPLAGNSGYLQGDFDMDTQVNNIDKIDVWAPNSGRGGQVPN